MAGDGEFNVEELHQSHDRLQAVIQSAPVGILEVDLDNRVTGWNPAAERIFGWSPEEILGRRVPIVPPSKQAEFREVLATVRAGRQFPSTETYRQRKDGTLVDVEIAAAPVRDSGGNVVSHMVVFTDITNRKRQERELRASRARIVEAADTERRRLERNLHDGAQQRLVAVALMLRLAGAALRKDPAGARRTLDNGCEELTCALEELRELARGLHPAILTNGGLGRALDALAGRSPVPVEIVGIPPERLPEAVEVAAYYVVAEALTNVAKYADATGARVEVRRTDGGALVEVVDDGRGGASPDGGSGLRGLVDRVEALGGRLTVHSPRGEGTTLRAEIPCRAAPDERREPRARESAQEVFTSVQTSVAERTGGDGAPVRVVVAEDSLLLRAGIVRVLEDSGFEVVAQAGDADELVRAFHDHHADAVMTDIRMPPTYTDEGLQAIRLIREEKPDTAVMVLTQYAEETYALELLGTGAPATGYLLKDRVTEPQAFADAFRTVARGGSVIDPEVVTTMLGGRPTVSGIGSLSERERTVASCVARGDRSRDIAGTVSATEGDVEDEIAAILEKLGLPPMPDGQRRTLAMLGVISGGE